MVEMISITDHICFNCIAYKNLIILDVLFYKDCLVVIAINDDSLCE